MIIIYILIYILFFHFKCDFMLYILFAQALFCCILHFVILMHLLFDIDGFKQCFIIMYSLSNMYISIKNENTCVTIFGLKGIFFFAYFIFKSFWRKLSVGKICVH